MEKKDSNRFLTKAIDETKSKGISWSLMNKSFDLRPLPQEDSRYEIAPVHGFRKSLSERDSYFAKYKSGFLTLLVYPEGLTTYPSRPPEDCFLSLRMQDDKSRYAVEIVNSNQNDARHELIRLYNIIDKDSSSVNALIDDFLNR